MKCYENSLLRKVEGKIFELGQLSGGIPLEPVTLLW